MAAKRVDVLLVTLALLTVHANFCVRTCRFVTGDGISNTHHMQEIFCKRVVHIFITVLQFTHQKNSH